MPEIIINGPEGRIEARYHHSKQAGAPIAIVLHPHPEHGGSMNNKITYAIYRTFVDMGFNTLRFNFRGVGKSEGKFDQGEGELSDTASVLDWMQSYNPSAAACWVAGFSFGAWIGMQLLMRRPELNGFVSINPPANLYDFNFLAPCPVSGMIIQGDRDEIVPKSSVDHHRLSDYQRRKSFL
jgi:alpha/beta superfamily hydrolase